MTSLPSTLPKIELELDTNSNITAATHSDIGLTADTKSELAANIKGDLQADTKSALTTDSKADLEVDLKPVEVDLCLKLGLDHLPSTRFCRDVSRHLGFTLFGVEIVGLNYVTDGATVVEDLGNRPFVVAKAPHHHHGVGIRGHGVRIRVGD
jgi:hypothetical protein